MRLHFTLFFVLSGALLFGQNMDNSQLDKVFNLVGDSVSGQPGRWQVWVEKVPMICISDQNNNRMRIISPVKSIKEATPEEVLQCMQANFHSALDVRYAIAEGVIWVAYIHPLKELTSQQVVDAVSQVRNAVVTYGGSYSSTELVFPKSEDETEEDEKLKKG